MINFLCAKKYSLGCIFFSLLMANFVWAVDANKEQDKSKNQNKAPVLNQGALLPRDSSDARVFRGGLVFSNYCVTCHGINADGNGRAARLYNPKPANLRTSDKNDAYLALIIKMGGEVVGRSPFMPPWGAELTDEQMKDLVAYLRSINENSPR